MTKRVAVLTDATSAEFWFPKWHQYYGGLFGTDALHLVTYQGRRADFRGFDLGGVWDVPHTYSDDMRARLISALAKALLTTHDVVIRCDVDEFLIPDPRSFASLRDYILQLNRPYVTAYGIDVFEKEGDAPLDLKLPILVSQRQHGIALSALHKTAVTRVPLDWGPGFHGASAVPQFDSLFMFHMKFADVIERSAWFEYMASTLKEGTSEHKYFSFSSEQMRAHKAWLSKKPCSSEGWAYLMNPEERQKFIDTVKPGTAGIHLGIHVGKFMLADSSFVIPEEFKNIV